MARADKLKNLKMPGKPMAEEEALMDLDMLGGEEMPGEEMPEEDDMMLEEGGAELGMLDDISDEELIAEMQKRALAMPEEEMLEEGEEEEGEDLEDLDAEEV